MSLSPLPWRVHYDEEHAFWDVECCRGGPWHSLLSEPTRDDATLMAAAPAMRDALERARNALALRNTALDSEERAVVRELDRLLAMTRPG